MHSILSVEFDINDLRVAVMLKLTELVANKKHNDLALGLSKTTDDTVVAGFVINESLIRDSIIAVARKKLGDNVTNGAVKTDFKFGENNEVLGAWCHFKYEVKQEKVI